MNANSLLAQGRAGLLLSRPHYETEIPAKHDHRKHVHESFALPYLAAQWSFVALRLLTSNPFSSRTDFAIFSGFTLGKA